MDDIGKAVIMAGQVLMFALAATVAVYLYGTLTNSIDGIMLASNYSNRGDAVVGLDKEELNDREDAMRDVHYEEVVLAILDLKSKYEKYGDIDSRVIVDYYDTNEKYLLGYNGQFIIWKTDYTTTPVYYDLNSVFKGKLLDHYNPIVRKDATYKLYYSDDAYKTLLYSYVD